MINKRAGGPNSERQTTAQYHRQSEQRTTAYSAESRSLPPNPRLPNITIMYRALSNSYVTPAIFLNPVLFLISLNTILSRVLPPITVDAAQQPPPYSTFGPSAQHPHLDIHASEKLCWSYTFLIVCAQLAAFQKVSECREESRLKARRKWKRIQAETGARKDNGMVFMTGNGCAIRVVEHGSETRKPEEQYDGSFGIDPTLWHLEASDEDSPETNDSETIL